MVVASAWVLDSSGVGGTSLESVALTCDTVELKRVVVYLYKNGDSRWRR